MKNGTLLKAGAAALLISATALCEAAGQTTTPQPVRPAGTATPPATKTPQPARTPPEMRPVGAAEGQNPPIKSRITPEELEKMKAERAKMAAQRAEAGATPGTPGAAPMGRASMLEDLKVYRFAVEVQDYESAVRSLCAFVAKNPQLNNYRDTLAALYIRNGQYTSALATLKKKTAVADERYGQELRVRALIGLERYDEAQSALAPLLEKEKTFSCEFDQALIHLHRKKYDEALKIVAALQSRKDGPAMLDFVSAQGAGAGATPAVLAFAKGMAEKGAGKNAAATFAEAAKLDPDFKPARDAARQ